MTRVYLYVMWLIQVACLVTILICSWRLLNREVFAIIASSIVLAVTLYVEHSHPEEDVS